MTSGDEEVLATIDDILSEITARTVRVRVLLRQDLLDQHAGLVAALDEALAADRARDGSSMDDAPSAPAAAQAVVDFEAEIEHAKREFVFKGVGKRAWADLLKDHPPTKDQLKANARIDHNPETFPAVAVAASCVTPKMSPAQAQVLEQKLDLTQWAQLWSAALSANIGDASSPKSQVAGGILRASAAFASTPATEGSLDLSSSAE